MKMPASFAFVSDNEMSYVTGGALGFQTDGWQLSTAVESWVDVVGNGFLQKSVTDMFNFDFVWPSLDWGVGGQTAAVEMTEEQKAAAEQAAAIRQKQMQFVLQLVGFGAAVYVLGTGAVNLSRK